MKLPRYADTGHVVEGCMTWPQCSTCKRRIKPVAGMLGIVDACECRP